MTAITANFTDLRQLWRDAARTGIQSGQDYPARRRIALINQASLLGAAISAAYGLVALAYAPAQLWQLVLLTPLEIGGFALAIWLNSQYRYTLARAISIVTPTVLITTAAWLLGNGAGAQLYFFVLWTAGFLLYTREERWLFLTAAGLWISCYLWIQISMGTPQVVIQGGQSFTDLVFILNAIGSFGMLGVLLSLFYAEISRTEIELQRQHRRSEDLLANILPKSVAEQLKDGSGTVAKGFSDVTLLFADIVGFTRLSGQLSPTEVIALLNQVFSRFDLLVEKLGLEKIKTIGDEYMLAGGLPEPCREHSALVAEAALQMMQIMDNLNEKTGRDLALRIGIHSGEVVAGVIGTRKFSYDVWGDTVNTASRMQSHSKPGRIQVSEQVFERLQDQFEFKARGTVRIRGKGRMQTWYLTGRKGG